MTRHFGIPNTSGRLTAGAHRQSSASRANTPRDLPPLPDGSILPNDLFSARDRNFAAGTFATVVLSLGFLIPMLCAGVILHFR
jgi:hypothetical protein